MMKWNWVWGSEWKCGASLTKSQEEQVMNRNLAHNLNAIEG